MLPPGGRLRRWAAECAVVDLSTALKARLRRKSSGRPGWRLKRRSIKPRFHAGLADCQDRGMPPEGNAAKSLAIPAGHRFRTETPGGALARSCDSRRLGGTPWPSSPKKAPELWEAVKTGGDGLRQGREAGPVGGSPQGPAGGAPLRGVGRRIQGSENGRQPPRAMGARGVGHEVGRRQIPRVRP